MYSIHKSEADKLSLVGRDVYVFIGSEKLKGENLTVGMTEVPPETAMKPHVHEDREEVIFIIEGTGEAIVGDSIEELRPETAVLFPIGVTHRVVNKSSGVLKFVFCFNPVNDFSGVK